MVQIGAQDERAGEDGLNADDLNGSKASARADSPAPESPAAGTSGLSSAEPRPAGSSAAGAVSPGNPAGAARPPGLGAGAVSPGDPAAAARPPGLGVGADDSTVILDMSGRSARPRPLSPSGALRPESAPQPRPDKPLASGPGLSPGGTQRDVPALDDPQETPQRPAPFNVWAKAAPGPLGAAANPLGSEPAWPAAPGAADSTRPVSPAPPGAADGTRPVSPAGSVEDEARAGAAGPTASGLAGGYPGGPHPGAATVSPGSGWSRSDTPRKRRLVPLIGIAAAIALVLAGVGVYLAQKSSPAHAAGAGHQNKAAPSASKPEHVVSVTPANGATGVNGAATISVVFSQPLSPGSPMPTLHPALKGTWHVHGDRADFVPDRGYRPRTRVTLKIPAGHSGVQSAKGGLLAAPVTAKFRTGRYSTARIEQLLAQLGYLPLTWAAKAGRGPARSDARAQVSAAYSPPAGSYTWQAGYPAALHRLWKPDAPSQVLRGAVMAFQADHGLTSDMIYENEAGLTLKGSIVHRLWKALFRAAAKHETNKHGYTYALASQHSPETLTVWHDGRKIFRNLANTGIPSRPTAVRTDPVYIRYQSQIMRGTNPDGSKYADPVAWVAYFHGGEAVHYFPRYSYGFPQSLGCVELPWDPAKRIWPYMTYGTLVTVTKA